MIYLKLQYMIIMLCNIFLIYNLVRIFQKTIYIFNQRKLIIYIYFTKDNGRDRIFEKKNGYVYKC